MVKRYILAYAYVLIYIGVIFGQVGEVPVHSSGPEIALTDVKKYDFTVPEQKIIAPDTVEPGEVIIAKAGILQNPPEYLVATTYRWKVLEDGKEKKNVQEWPDGTSVLFGAGIQPGKQFTIILSVSYLYLVKEKDKDNNTKVVAVGQRSSLLITIVIVKGVTPPPAPPIPPNPGPIPPVPDTKFGLTKKAYQWAVAYVPSSSRTQGAIAISNAMNGIAASVAAGTLKDINTLLLQTKNANQTSLKNAGVSIAEWDNFFVQLQKEIYSLYSSGKMSTVQDFADAWREIAEGLSKVK